MSLKASIDSDADSLFISLSDFAEAVTYLPRQLSGQPAKPSRQINAVVFREAMENAGEDNSESITPIFEVHVANNPVTGISSTEINKGGDQISLPVRDGLTPVARTIVMIQSQDHGMLVLQCR